MDVQFEAFLLDFVSLDLNTNTISNIYERMNMSWENVFNFF